WQGRAANGLGFYTREALQQIAFRGRIANLDISPLGVDAPERLRSDAPCGRGTARHPVGVIRVRVMPVMLEDAEFVANGVIENLTVQHRSPVATWVARA